MPDDPTEEEIAERCERIRETWTPAERARRAGGREVQGWTVPEWDGRAHEDSDAV